MLGGPPSIRGMMAQGDPGRDCRAISAWGEGRLRGAPWALHTGVLHPGDAACKQTLKGTRAARARSQSPLGWVP